jgi:isoquinoline 1-oxidoreductase alpha subunit
MIPALARGSARHGPAGNNKISWFGPPALVYDVPRYDLATHSETMSKYKLNVNGKTQVVDVEADTPLLWALRDTLNLVGTKYGCGIGACGACTVHIDGQPARACQMPVSSVGKHKITTIEGLDARAAHPLQQAWQELDVPQCGYCQSGQIMSACALLKQHPRPSDAQIDDAMAGNLCRCATYVRIRAGIHRAAEIASASGSSSASNTGSTGRGKK